MQYHQTWSSRQTPFDEGNLNTQKVKGQLAKDIDWDNRRTNVDSSKKIACMQQMDYDGFRQMVLGANLKPMKKDQASMIFDVRNTESSINHTATYARIVSEDGTVGYDEEAVRGTLQLGDKDQLEPPTSAEAFDKFLCKKLTDAHQRYIYMRLLDFSVYLRLFVNEIDPEIFIMMTNTFLEQVIRIETFNNEQEQTFVCDLLTMLAK
jgi:hypothetical protein